MKVLNLYAGLGGNRKLWTNVEVTAVELNKSIAEFYKDHFPQDKVIITDAHSYLLEHYSEFDFIWSSPLCPTHSRANFWANAADNRIKPYPDMSLYQEIIFLQHYCKSLFVVENVIPYYPPLITAKEVDRHLFWANFNIGSFNTPPKKKAFNLSTIKDWQEYYGFDLTNYKIDNKLKTLRNCVHPQTGLYILNCALQRENTTQMTLFS